MNEQPMEDQPVITSHALPDTFSFTAENILEQLPVAYYVCNAKGEITAFNQMALEIWGQNPSEGQLESDFFKGLRTYREKSGKDNSPLLNCLKDGKPRSDLHSEIRNRNETFSIIEQISPIRSGSEIVGAVSLFQKADSGSDLNKKISKRDLRQSISTLEAKNIALLNSDEIYHKMIGEIEDYAIILLDKDGTILNWNKGAERIKGYKQEEIVGKNFRVFYTPEDRENKKPDTLIHIARTTGKALDEGWRMRKNGSRFWGSIVITALHDDNGEVSGFVKVTRELTEKKEAEEELKKSEERYHKMIDEIEDYAIILLDKNGIIQNWNKGAEKIKGYKQEEIVGKNFSIFYTPEDIERDRPNKLITLARTTGKAADEGWRMRKDGTRFWGSIVITALHNKAGEVIGFSKVTRDLTERKFAEDKLREYSSELEFQNKELEQFAYAASHDMKEPLRKIHLYNSFINENPSNTLDTKSREYLNRSINAVKRMNDLIEDLLTYSKSTSTVESFEETDVNALLKDIVSQHKEEFEQKHVNISIDPMPKMQVVPFQFNQLMDNLVSNSIKYRHPERNVEINIKYGSVKGATLNNREAEPEMDYHRISVIDNGIGFETQYEQKVFEIFQRLSNPTGAKGSGIGLAICKKIVQNHKGFIKAIGRMNEGATFEVYLPKDPDHLFRQ